MKKDWKEIEGRPVRIDVNSTFDEAIGEGMEAEVLCFTKDNRVVMNGEEFPKTEPYLMRYEGEDDREDRLPQIIEEPGAVTEDGVWDFVNEYPLEEIGWAMARGRMAIAVVEREEGDMYIPLVLKEMVWNGTEVRRMVVGHERDGCVYRTEFWIDDDGAVRMRTEKARDIFEINKLLTLVD